MDLAIPTDAISETFQDVEEMIKRLCEDTVKRYGGDFDEYFSEAQLGFLAAYETFDESAGAFRSWVYRKCSSKVLHAVRKRVNQARLLREASHVVWAVSSGVPSFSLREFGASLSFDARVVLSLTIDSPVEIMETTERHGGSTRNHRSAIRTFLRGDLRWTGQRIKDAFREITSALA